MNKSRLPTGGDFRPKAYTLVEMLVTIAIIAILAAVLFSSVQMALAQARKTGCVANLRQDGIAFHTYAVDHNNELPPNPDYTLPPYVPFWLGEISPYLSLPTFQVPYSGPNVLKCPAYPSKPEWHTYTMNANLYPDAVPQEFYTTKGVPLVRVKNPEMMVLLFDGGDGNVASGYPAAIMAKYFIEWRHPGSTANFLSVSGSVSSYSNTSDITTDDDYWVPR